MTFCSGWISTVAEAKLFSRKTKKQISKRNRHRRVSQQNDRGRNVRPAEPMIDSRKQAKDEKQSAGQTYDDFLLFLFLGLWPRLHAPLEQHRIMANQIEGDGEKPRRQNSEKQPELPIGKRPRGQQQHCGEKDDEAKDGSERAAGQRAHCH